jgi:hypothetical protein
MSDKCVACEVLAEQIRRLTEEKDRLMDRLMAALSPPAYQAFQGIAQAGPEPELIPSETIVDNEGESWVKIAGKLVKQKEWKTLLQGAVYLDEAGRPQSAEETDRAMDKLNEMLGGGRP